jgi:predicted acylesterase/phospholipase RssA
MFHRAFGQVAIEELDLGFSCGTAELHSGELVRHRFGALWERVAMSMTLPGLAPPVVSGQRVFVDGGVIDHLPVRSMAADGEGPIIAVDATSTLGRPRGAGADASAPPLRETLTRVLLLGSANTAKEAPRWANLVITPRSEGIGLLEFHQLDRAREAGRRAAREALGDAPAELFAPA